MNQIVKIIFVLVIAGLQSSCTQGNYLTEFGSTTSDEALVINAKKAIDNFSWDSAIEILTTKVSAGYRNREDVKRLAMSAYAGKCGLIFTNIADSMTTASGNLFALIMGMFGNSSVDVASCDSALAILKDIGTPAERSADLNLFAAFLGLTKMGTQLHSKLDNESSGLGDGTVDAGWDTCPDSADPNRLSDAEVKKVITGMGTLFENLTFVTASLGGGASAVSSITAAKEACEVAINPPTGTPGGCDITDEDSPAISDTLIRTYRRMMSSSTLGFGTCDLSVLLPVPECCPGIAFP